MATERIKVLFDTDIGSDIDDAVALGYLLAQDRCELLGVTTVTGEPDKRAEMVSAVCCNIGRDDVPIHPGSPTPLLAERRQKKAHQGRALGAWARRRDFAPSTAVGFLQQTIRAHPDEVTLVATGPMTNVGLLFATDPEIPSLLKQLVLMCGHFFGEISPEWNAKCDPHATAIAYGAGNRTSPPRHASIGLDVTRRCAMSAEECRERFAAKVLEPVRDFAEVWFERRDKMTFHDPLAAACIFEPDLCEYRQGEVTVSLSEKTLGWTLFEEDTEEKPHTVAANVNADRFFEHYFEIVK